MENETKTFDIYPTSKFRRILCFLLDILIFFISSIFVFEIIASPIMKVSINYPQIMERVSNIYSKRTEILIENDVLFSENDGEYNFETSLFYTSDMYIKDYSLNKEITHDVFYNYFEELESVNNLMLKYGKDYIDLEKTTNIGTYSFKQEVINLVAPKYVEGDEMSEDGKRMYSSLQNNLFLPLYSEIINDIIINDLYFENNSYNFLTQEVEKESNVINLSYKITASIVFIVIGIIFNFVIPLTNFKGKTIGEMIMKMEHVDIGNYRYLKKRFVAAQGIMNTLNSTAILFLIPMISLENGRFFTLNELVSISIVGILFVIVELVIMSISKYNRSLKEYTTNSIVVDTEVMDEYYKLKGFDF